MVVSASMNDMVVEEILVSQSPGNQSCAVLPDYITTSMADHNFSADQASLAAQKQWQLAIIVTGQTDKNQFHHATILNRQCSYLKQIHVYIILAVYTDCV